ncbi:MAG: hypothetical protein VB032_04375, partial [Burkholderiaceae bacterium]|nr:hypothetical protein [Burkholderiaceae bacterium]
MGVQSNAFLAVFYHPDSRFANIVGQYSLDFETPGGQRLRRLMDEYRGRIRVIYENELVDDRMSRRHQQMRNLDLNRFGLRIDESDCITIVNKGVPVEIIGKPAQPLKEDDRFVKIVSCGVKTVPVDQAIEQDRAHAAAIMDKVQQACPDYFPATSPAVFRFGDKWARSDMNTDNWMLVSEIYVIAQPNREVAFPLARIADIERGEATIDCSLLHKRK